MIYIILVLVFLIIFVFDIKYICIMRFQIETEGVITDTREKVDDGEIVAVVNYNFVVDGRKYVGTTEHFVDHWFKNYVSVGENLKVYYCKYYPKWNFGETKVSEERNKYFEKMQKNYEGWKEYKKNNSTPERAGPLRKDPNDLCQVCGKPYRTTRAYICYECGNTREIKLKCKE